jgi:hypothetical protein
MTPIVRWASRARIADLFFFFFFFLHVDDFSFAESAISEQHLDHVIPILHSSRLQALE